MKFARLPFTCAMLLALAPLRAETLSTRLTPDKTGDRLYSFAIQVERRKEAAGDVLDVAVRVTTKNDGGHIEPNQRTGALEVFDGKQVVSSCAVMPTAARNGDLVFSFRVAAKFAGESKFIFAETSDPADKRGDGNFYWFTLADFAKDKQEGKKAVIEWGAKTSGVRCAVALASDEKLYAGEPIQVRFLTANVDAKAASVVVEGHPLSVYKMTVLGPDGKPAALTQYGRQQADGSRDGSRGTGQLAAGKEDQGGILLSRVYDMTRKGDYTVSFTRSVRVDGTEVSVPSNTLKIAVLGERAEYVPN